MIMAELGKVNQMNIVKKVDFGLYLDGGEMGEILMPKRYVTKDMKPGDSVEVMVYLDGEERYVATTEKPKAVVGDFASLRVNKVEKSGAFLDWGLSKELMVPFSEQKVKMEEGRSYIVYVYIDRITGRITASMKLERFFSKEKPPYQAGDEVDLLIWTPTDLGYKAIIDNKYLGVVYKNEIFKKINSGNKLRGFVKKVRDDGKIDLSLESMGYKKKIGGIAGVVLEKLKTAGGFLPYHDKTDPDVIYSIFGVSKKTFKQAVGNLYKLRLIEMDQKGIKLTEKA